MIFFKGCRVKIIIIHKIRVDTQYLHEYTTTQYIIIYTQKDNSYIYVFYLTHTYQKVSLPFVKVCVNVRNPWYITESLSLDI